MSVVTLLTDYGLEDDFVGVCHGVVARIAPEVRIIDVTHGIPRHDVRTGALVLRRTLAYLPDGVHVAVVDPGVGSPRRAVVLRPALGERLLVGPDNGLLVPAADRLGGIVEAVDVSRSPLRLEPVSATFHGRDVFAPVAAHLAAGAAPAEAGDPLDPDEIVRLELPAPRSDGDALVAHALGTDRFGNVTLDVEHAHLDGSGLRLGRPITVDGRPAHFATTFADVPAGGLLLYEDAYRSLALAVNRGSAAEELGLTADAEVRLAPGR